MKIFQIFVTMTAIFLSSGYINAQNMETTVPEISAFPTGKPNVAYEQYFSGRSWLAPLTSMKELNVPVSNVTFEPGCRNNWHIHHGGAQVLIAVGGRGYYQIEGQEPKELKAGEAVCIPADTKHWHGAAPGESFSHLAFMVSAGDPNAMSNE